MANLGRLNEFDITHPEQWISYVSRVDNYLRANQVTDDGLKAATLLCVCGQATFDIAENLIAPASIESMAYADLKKILSEHFEPKLSVIARRHAFEQRAQRSGESAAEFVAALRQASRKCEFTDLEDRLRDRLVCGLHNRELQRRLFAMEKLTFQDTLKEVMADEAVGGAMKTLRPQSTHTSPPVIHQGAAEGSEMGREIEEIDRLRREALRRPRSIEKATPPQSCASCGGQHEKAECRFRTAVCCACGKQGHIARVCRSRQGKRPPGQNRVEYCSGRRSIQRTGVQHPIKEKIRLHLKLQGVPCSMELDTGSVLSII
uniref:CCHC-type domain-containing protein n=1 Tax=Leptobrachium leishanense TaxID=445787 RepID=A0A8C5MUD5_9ANUR